MQRHCVFLIAVMFCASARAADWPMLRGDALHAGYRAGEIKTPVHLAWAREFPNERLGTAMEPIVAANNVLVATHAGNLFALHAGTGEPRWRFQAHGPFLHSPAFHDGVVIAANSDGNIYALRAANGEQVWNYDGGRGGYAASPVMAEGVAFIGSRTGEFVAVDLRTGKPRWKKQFNAPFRQTAAYHEGKVYITGEDLIVRCFQASDGKVLWTSQPLAGQTARDYYPVIVQQGGRTFVVICTNPLLTMSQRIGRDRTMLCRNAGVDDSGWQKLDAWVKRAESRGTPELWAKEQAAITQYLQANPDARSFFALDAATGQDACVPPVLWIGGCQSVAVPPTLTPDGRLLVFYRSAYGNWNHGVAPLVALGLLDLAANKIEPLFHTRGRQPPWNTFWGTADESQNFVVVGETVMIIHQGTLSGFDLRTHDLFRLHGERDSYGGFPNPAWARNEWHGPARSGVAVVDARIYWQTGSRILCLAEGKAREQNPVFPQSVEATNVPTIKASPLPLMDRAALREQLAVAVRELLSTNWAPLFTDPGLAGRHFAFDNSGDLFEALAWAYPHLSPELRLLVRTRLETELKDFPPWTKASWYPLQGGARREWFPVPPAYAARAGGERLPHPFGNFHTAALFARRSTNEPLLLQHWPELKSAYSDFIKSGWRLDGAKGDPFANRYLASLLAFAQLAHKADDPEMARQAEAKAKETTEALLAWWERAATTGSLRTFKTSAELDPFIRRGDSISLALAPHRHKVALLADLTSGVAEILRDRAPQATAKVWETFALLYRTWPFVGEERQVHFGENFVDPPDLALAGFKGLIWLRPSQLPEALAALDLPASRADLYYIIKLGLLLEKAVGQ